MTNKNTPTAAADFIVIDRAYGFTTTIRKGEKLPDRRNLRIQNGEFYWIGEGGYPVTNPLPVELIEEI
jgi:hypothetical protein